MTAMSKSGYILKGRVIDGTLQPPLERGAAEWPPGRSAVLVKTRDIRILQRPGTFDYIFKDGVPVDRTRQPARARKWYERQKTFLAGLYVFDEETGRGKLVQ
jgi:hypothetical protein